jgi:positive regulator of sigma E activity
MHVLLVAIVALILVGMFWRVILPVVAIGAVALLFIFGALMLAGGLFAIEGAVLLVFAIAGAAGLWAFYGHRKQQRARLEQQYRPYSELRLLDHRPVSRF